MWSGRRRSAPGGKQVRNRRKEDRDRRGRHRLDHPRNQRSAGHRPGSEALAVRELFDDTVVVSGIVMLMQTGVRLRTDRGKTHQDDGAQDEHRDQEARKRETRLMAILLQTNCN